MHLRSGTKDQGAGGLSPTMTLSRLQVYAGVVLFNLRCNSLVSQLNISRLQCKLVKSCLLQATVTSKGGGGGGGLCQLWRRLLVTSASLPGLLGSTRAVLRKICCKHQTKYNSIQLELFIQSYLIILCNNVCYQCRDRRAHQ